MRKKLPVTRSSITSRIEVDNLKAYVTTGFYEDGQPGEIFIKVAKNGSFLCGAFDVIAVQTSMMLQNGISCSEVLKKWKNSTFEKAPLLQAVAEAIEHHVSLMGGQIERAE